MRRPALILAALFSIATLTAAQAPATASQRPAVRMLTAAPAPACADITPSPQLPGTPLRILAVGDSITAACQWQTELDRLLTKAAIPHIITTYAVGGSRCRYWTDYISGVLTTAQPDLVYLYCGTNDDPNESCYGESCTAWSYRVIVEAVHTYRPARPALTVPTLIGYSDATMSPDWLMTNEPRTNDALYGQMGRYMPPTTTPSWYAGTANIQVMPGTAEYLDGDTCDPAKATCAIHPNTKGYRTIGRLMYDAAAGGMGWPSASTLGEPVLCGMSGHRKGYPRPSYTPCQG